MVVADLEMELIENEKRLLKHLVLEPEELQLQSLLEEITPAPFLTTVQSPVGVMEPVANWVTEAHQIKKHPP